MKIYYYLFYRFYTLAVRAKLSDPEFTALGPLALIEIFNMLSVFRIISSINYTNVGNKYYDFILAVVIFIINYAIFFYKKRYKKINDDFQNESKTVKVISSVLVVSLTVFTLVFFIYVIETFNIPPVSVE